MSVKKPDKSAKQPVTQLDKFKEAAKQVGTDDREEAFDRTLKTVAKAPKVAVKASTNGRK